MILGTGQFRCLALAGLCLVASGCPNGNLRGKAGVASPPVPSPALAIQTPPQPGTGPGEQGISLTSQAAEQIIAVSPLTQEKQEPTEENLPAKAIDRLRALHRLAFQRVLTMDTYTLRLKRREVVNGKKKPEEIILVKFRKEPFSVYLKWVGTEGNQREVVYVKGQHGNQIHTRLAAGDVFLMPAGTRFSLAPDNPLVRANSRHPITEAGLGNLIDQFGLLVEALEKNDTRLGTVKYLGVLKRPEVETKVEGILQLIPPGGDPSLPQGGQRLWFFDVNQNLPVLLITRDENGREIEFYCHDQIVSPVVLDDDAFDPDKLWGKK